MTMPATSTFRKITRLRRRRLWIAVGVVCVVSAVCVGIVPSLAGRFARPRVDARLAALAARMQCPITFRDLDASWQGVVRLHDIVVGPVGGEGGPVLTVGRVLVSVAPMDLLRGRLRPRHVWIEALRLHTDPAGLVALRDVVSRLRGSGGASVDVPVAGGQPAMPRIEIEDGDLELALGTGRVLSINGLEAAFVQEEGRPIDITMQLRLSLDGALPVAVSGAGSLDPEAGAALAIDAATPVDIRVPGPGESFARLSGLTLDVDSRAGMVAVALRNLRVTGVGELVGRVRPGWLANGGVFQSPDVRLTAAIGEYDDAVAGAFSRLRALEIRQGSAAVTIARDPALVLELRGLSVNLDQAGDDGRLRLVAKGMADLDGRGDTRLSLDGVLDHAGVLESADLSLRGPLPVQVASRLHPRLLQWPGAQVDLEATVRREGTAYSGTANLAAEGLTYFWTRICLVPVTDLAFDAKLAFALDLDAGTIHLTADPLRVGRAWANVDVDVEGLGAKPRIDAQVRVPSQSCEAVAAAIPRVLIPRLEGALFDGQMDLALDASVDLSRLGPKGEPLARFKASGDLESCRAVTLGPLIRLKDLEKGRFVHVVREADLAAPLYLGPATSSYVPLEEIPDFVYQAALATEDMGFFKHQGFMPNLIRRALSMNVQYGWFVYGGSTISQQLVKNLYLSREKTLARKLEEAIIVWQMERLLPKERILELYLNCIEYGKHIYGIRAAANAYFNKAVSELTPLDAAFIMATKPKPRYAWTIYEKGEFTQWWVDRMQGILQRLWEKMEVIDQRTFLSAAPYLPLFWYPTPGAYRRPYTDPSVVVPQGMPADLPRDDAPPAEGQVEARAVGRIEAQ